jgi:hypothetical protein
MSFNECDGKTYRAKWLEKSDIRMRVIMIARR